MTFSNRVTTITQDYLLPTVVDTILSDNFITFRAVSNGKAWRGTTMNFPVKVSKNTLGGSFSGNDTFSTQTVNTRILLTYDPRGYEIPVSIPGMERAVNKGEAEVLNLVRTELESTQQDGLDAVGTMLYADGTGNSNKDFLGFDALNDDGTTAINIGGQSRTTYSTLAGTRTASGGTMTLAKIATLISAVSAGAAVRQRPTTLVSNETVQDIYETLLTPFQRNNYEANGFPTVTRRSKGPLAAQKAAAGYTAYTFRGIPWVADEKSTAQTLWAWNENYTDWYGIKDDELKQISFGKENVEGPYSEAPSDNTGFQWTGFMRPIDQYGDVAHLMLLGNFVTNNPKRQGRLTGITG